MKNHHYVYLAFLLVMLLFTACAPQAMQAGPVRPVELESAEAQAVNQTATAAWHRMQAEYLETGSYSTNVLADLSLPPGVRWTLEAFTDEAYVLRFTSNAVPDYAWFVSPEGVRIRQL